VADAAMTYQAAARASAAQTALETAASRGVPHRPKPDRRQVLTSARRT